MVFIDSNLSHCFGDSVKRLPSSQSVSKLTTNLLSQRVPSAAAAQWHSDSDCLEIEKKLLGHSLIRSLVRSHRSLIACYALLARSLTRSCARGIEEYFCLIFYMTWITVKLNGSNYLVTCLALHRVHSRHLIAIYNPINETTNCEFWPTSRMFHINWWSLFAEWFAVSGNVTKKMIEL